MNPTSPPWADPASSSIAVIGIGCRYPGAKTAAELWENILGRRRQFRRMPDVRLPNAEYQSHDRATPDKTYGTRAAVIDGYAFDWAEKRIPKQTYESTDLAHWLALDVVLQMLKDAGYTAADLPRETTQVVVGNTLTGEFTRANTLRSRWPFVKKMLALSAADMGIPPTRWRHWHPSWSATSRPCLHRSMKTRWPEAWPTPSRAASAIFSTSTVAALWWMVPARRP